ncbi:MAG: hypothetical protein HY276_04000 [Ignavibacteriales bacterium]|nr:hypothetical protein [Ignavibacteriales bacterium]
MSGVSRQRRLPAAGRDAPLAQKTLLKTLLPKGWLRQTSSRYTTSGLPACGRQALRVTQTTIPFLMG